jgi:uncharacterized membrane protein
MVSQDAHGMTRRVRQPTHFYLDLLPLVLFIGSLLCDSLFWQSGDSDLASPSLWLIGAGLVMALIAAAVGQLDGLRGRQVLAAPDFGIYIGAIVVGTLLQLANWCLRYSQGSSFVVPAGFELSAFAIFCLLVGAWTGWQMRQR